MNRLSSNWTLFLKIFLPVFWLSFFGGFVIAAFISNQAEIPFFTSTKFKLVSVSFVLGGLLFFILTFFRLKRVDADHDFIYITNYIKTYRYNFDSIEKLIIYDHLIIKAVHLYFKDNTSLGKKIIFLPYMESLNDFCSKNEIKIENFKSNQS